MFMFSLLAKGIKNQAKNLYFMSKIAFMRKVMVFGTFDILHPGHMNFLKQARRYGDYLIVVVARDKTVRRVKQRHPMFDERQRHALVKKVEGVNRAVLGYTGDKYRVIEKYKPQVICLGYDQLSFTEDLDRILLKRGLKARVVRLKPFKHHLFKSSKLRDNHPKKLQAKGKARKHKK